MSRPSRGGGSERGSEATEDKNAAPHYLPPLHSLPAQSSNGEAKTEKSEGEAASAKTSTTRRRDARVEKRGGLASGGWRGAKERRALRTGSPAKIKKTGGPERASGRARRRLKERRGARGHSSQQRQQGWQRRQFSPPRPLFGRRALSPGAYHFYRRPFPARPALPPPRRTQTTSAAPPVIRQGRPQRVRTSRRVRLSPLRRRLCRARAPASRRFFRGLLRSAQCFCFPVRLRSSATGCGFVS